MNSGTSAAGRNPKKVFVEPERQASAALA